eukprot:TRINITY_DN1118_c0_g1_i7.p3 TRINITY_DN1118_c0_g1~~TRINITY_DN1118_c0_g1_i7.p3  ORF type:complete len:102 (+),score=0.16 TRINITY_DN1118_c0_g1_i7:990-1295(+)
MSKRLTTFQGKMKIFVLETFSPNLDTFRFLDDIKRIFFWLSGSSPEKARENRTGVRSRFSVEKRATQHCSISLLHLQDRGLAMKDSNRGGKEENSACLAEY